MKPIFCVASMCAASLCAGIEANAQVATRAEASGTQLELTVEVATTSEDGYPEALRVTLENVGGVGLTNAGFGGRLLSGQWRESAQFVDWLGWPSRDR